MYFTKNRAKKETIRLESFSLCAFIMSLRAILSWPDLDYISLTNPDYRAAVTNQEIIAEEEIIRISKIPGSVSCSVRTICYLAGKSYVYDPYAVSQQIATNHMTADEVAQLSKNIKFENIPREALWVHRSL
jgi:hypothetical protein